MHLTTKTGLESTLFIYNLREANTMLFSLLWLRSNVSSTWGTVASPDT